MATSPNINFFLQDVVVPLPPRKKLKIFIEQIFRKEGKKLQELNYVFCTDMELLKINKTYLKHDFYTDIITFNLSDDPRQVIGEIYVSGERVKENALQFHTTIRNELLRVMFHGALHLCGYKDASERQKGTMTKKEDLYLAAYLKTNA